MIRLRVSYNQIEGTLSRNSLRYLSKANLPMAIDYLLQGTFNSNLNPNPKPNPPRPQAPRGELLALTLNPNVNPNKPLHDIIITNSV